MTALTGRIGAAPAEVWHEEVLAPQFEYEVQHVGWYVAAEKVLLAEYVRMGLAGRDEAAAVAARLDGIGVDTLRADPAANLSDIAFAVERHVTAGPRLPFAAWHVDRSRNDLQACVQRLVARDRLLGAVEQLLAFGAAAGRLAAGTVELPMPGHTHLQAAQVVTPAFWLAALGAETLDALDRLRHTYGQLDRCPLGSGAMAGQELAWDRDRMARLLGFEIGRAHV